jgi:hypothetical protein
MFDTEHSGALLTPSSELTSLRRDAGECHDRLHSPSSLVLPPAKFTMVSTHKSFSPHLKSQRLAWDVVPGG